MRCHAEDIWSRQLPGHSFEMMRAERMPKPLRDTQDYLRPLERRTRAVIEFDAVGAAAVATIREANDDGDCIHRDAAEAFIGKMILMEDIVNEALLRLFRRLGMPLFYFYGIIFCAMPRLISLSIIP